MDPEIHKMDLTANLDEYLLILDNLEEKVSNISVPPAYSEELYSLRLHIDMLRNKLYRAREKEKRTK